MGYSGGGELAPTYRSIKDSTEAILLEYDPMSVSFRQLLVEWSRQHAPYQLPYSTQYRSVIFYSDDEEKTIAESFLKEISAMRNNVKIYTSVEPMTKFYQAEEYHQHYLAKLTGSMGI